jgi:hypothetical protein
MEVGALAFLWPPPRIYDKNQTDNVNTHCCCILTSKFLTSRIYRSMLKCSKCGSEIPDTEERCPTCGFNVGPPNIRAAARPEEEEALEKRYQSALELAVKNDCLSIVQRFQQSVKQSSAVLNVNLNFLHFFVTSESSLYTNYEGGVRGGLRKPASLYDDLERRGVTGTLFGSYADRIIYAALSMDGSGLDSYGHYAIKLREVAVENRATILENNSYTFRKKHNIQPGDRGPLGCIATWANKDKLAVAKTAEYIKRNTREVDFPRLLLSSTGDRKTDEFMEVQIYGTFDLNALESVKGRSNVGPKNDRDLLRMVKEHLKNLGKDWIEE